MSDVFRSNPEVERFVDTYYQEPFDNYDEDGPFAAEPDEELLAINRKIYEALDFKE